MPGESSLDCKQPETAPWSLILLLVGAGVVASFQVGKAPPVLPFIRVELSMNLFMAGWILSTFSITGLVFGSVIGTVADAFGHRRFVLWGLVCQAAASFLGSLASGAELLLLTRVFEGFGFFMIAVAAPAMIFRITPVCHHRLALSVWSCYVPAGVAAIMLLAPLLTSRFGWRGLWQVNTVILLAYGFWVMRATSGIAAFRGGKPLPWKTVFENIVSTTTAKGPLLLSAIFGSYALQWLTVMGFLPTLLMEDHGLDPAKAAVLTAVMVAMNMPGNLAGGWFLQRGFRRWQLISVASLVMGLCSLAIYSPHFSFAVRYGACLLFSGVGGLIPSSVLSGASVYAPSKNLVAATNGLFIQGAQFGQLVGPPVLGLVVASAGGWHVAPWFLGSSAALGIMLSFWLRAFSRSR
jgi:MFS family permease